MTLIELCEKRPELFSFEFVRNCLRNEAGKTTRTNPPSYRLGQVGRKADGELGG
jgi:hypothetical protein